MVIIMIKLKEILFLKNLKDVGKATIYDKYWEILKESDDFYDLVSEVELESELSKEETEISMNYAENLYDDLFNSDIDVITVFDENYPKQLNIMGNKKPLILYVKGNLDSLTKPNIGVIGTRKPYKVSVEFEELLVKNIVNVTNRVILSGLALGCDKIAHQTTVDENKITIAVLPSDITKITPASNKKLAEEIIKTGGCLISEYEPGVKFQKGHYIERDRMVAALSQDIFVVECGVNSGTLHTVDFAQEYGKQIYSFLPNEYPEGFYEGNQLILSDNKNALKIDNVDDVLDKLKNSKNQKKSKSVQQKLI